MSDTTGVQAALVGAAIGGTVTLEPRDYEIDAPLLLAFAQSVARPTILGNGARLHSAITNGQPVLRISNAPGTWVQGLLIDNLSIFGNGSEGNLLEIDASDNSGGIYNAALTDIFLKGGGADGLVATGAFFESCLTRFTAESMAAWGATLGSGTTTGSFTDVYWHMGAVRSGGKGGVRLVNNAYDLKVRDVKFVGNKGPGLLHSNGFSLLDGCNFENNVGPAIVGGNFGVIRNVSFGSSEGVQTCLLDGSYPTLLELENVRGSPAVYGPNFRPPSGNNPYQVS